MIDRAIFDPRRLIVRRFVDRAATNTGSGQQHGIAMNLSMRVASLSQIVILPSSGLQRILQLALEFGCAFEGNVGLIDQRGVNHLRQLCWD